MSVDKPVDTAGGDEGFLSRWARRKEATRLGETVAAEEQAEHLDALAEGEEQLPAVQAEEEAEYLPTDEDMPPLESLTEESDYSGFLSPRVSEELRKLALRKLFHSAPFNIRDGLDDYDGDYTYFEKLGDIVTSDMRHQMEMEEERRRAAEAEEAAAAEQEEDAAQEASAEDETTEQPAPEAADAEQSNNNEPEPQSHHETDWEDDLDEVEEEL